MNLDDVLNYRNRCLICNQQMELKALDLAGVRLQRTNAGLMLETSLVGQAVHFNYDGTYKKMKHWNSLYVKPLNLLKECPTCLPEDLLARNNPIVYKSRSVGATTLARFKEKRCAYTFNLFGDSEGNFDSNLEWEDIKFFQEDKFYQMKTQFSDDSSEILMGSNAYGFDGLMRLSLPAIHIKNIGSAEEFIDKIKLFNLFS